MSTCKICIHNQDGHDDYCNNCTVNPAHKNNFKSNSEYYPLALRGTHIIQWFDDGEHCMSIAIFKYYKSEEYWDLAFVGNRPLINGVNWDDFRSLVEIGFNMLGEKND